MKRKLKILIDLPKNACGRCQWWAQLDDEGWGKCSLLDKGEESKRFYQCMVCEEYEKMPDSGNSINY